VIAPTVCGRAISGTIMYDLIAAAQRSVATSATNFGSPLRNTAGNPAASSSGR
jgi:hypothetical protein